MLALQPKAASAGCTRGHWLSSPQPSREPQRYAPSSPPAASGFRALRAAHLYNPLLRLPKGGTLQGTQSAQPSADRSTRPSGQVAPASGWAASSFHSPVGLRNEPSLRFGLLALAPSALRHERLCGTRTPASCPTAAVCSADPLLKQRAERDGGSASGRLARGAGGRLLQAGKRAGRRRNYVSL